jgi:hypothetical protein
MSESELASGNRQPVNPLNIEASMSDSKEGAQCWRGEIRIEKNRLIDEHGRTILLRGVNLTGNSKLPHFPAKASTPGTDEFYDHRNVSFLGRPFSEIDAHEHFERLYNWGLTFARILVSWEALGEIRIITFHLFTYCRTCWAWNL